MFAKKLCFIGDKINKRKWKKLSIVKMKKKDIKMKLKKTWDLKWRKKKLVEWDEIHLNTPLEIVSYIVNFY